MAAEAIRFAVEELPSPRLLGVFMQVGVRDSMPTAYGPFTRKLIICRGAMDA